ncbi:NADH-cytochrome b5 reductase-like protein [Selaginella moellendorffii]|uniref:NADH-cytochrome b5 reductase-like protein n=1 Tax=Selaginella moellendorffii TaxID=88036 RepID=UPI000D1C4624|nr:NADH-cytochrome b5 reductase-like protein [Selaginella moellendorffii]|eukprot:XP_024535904.1 NADH-cytochrome b5 reductase-like protein [Selaginella moellendorffii]
MAKVSTLRSEACLPWMTMRNVASCLLTKAAMGTKKDGKPNVIIRPYTPISDPYVRGHFDYLSKTYPQEKMSKYFAALRPGDTLEMKGCVYKLPYSANMKARIGVIAGGTGITPMFQVLNKILKNPEDKTQVSLIYANLTPDDILLKNELDKLAEKHPNFKVFYVVDKPTHYWGGGSGFITKDILVKGLPPPSDGNLIMVCGPPGLINHISGAKAPDKSQGQLTGLLKSMGYTEDQSSRHSFILRTITNTKLFKLDLERGWSVEEMGLERGRSLEVMGLERGWSLEVMGLERGWSLEDLDLERGWSLEKGLVLGSSLEMGLVLGLNWDFPCIL